MRCPACQIEIQFWNNFNQGPASWEKGFNCPYCRKKLIATNFGQWRQLVLFFGPILILLIRGLFWVSSKYISGSSYWWSMIWLLSFSFILSFLYISYRFIKLDFADGRAEQYNEEKENIKNNAQFSKSNDPLMNEIRMDAIKETRERRPDKEIKNKWLRIFLKLSVAAIVLSSLAIRLYAINTHKHEENARILKENAAKDDYEKNRQIDLILRYLNQLPAGTAYPLTARELKQKVRQYYYPDGYEIGTGLGINYSNFDYKSDGENYSLCIKLSTGTKCQKSKPD